MVDEPEPTAEQLAYINGEPDAVLVACPGSGKTAACARRFLRRASLKSPHAIAYLSYTNTAVDQARDRIVRLGGSTIAEAPNFVGTIDAFFQRFLFRPFISQLITGVHSAAIKVFGTGGGETPPLELSRSELYNFYNGTHGGAKSWQVRTRIRSGDMGFFEGRSNVPLGREAQKACFAKKKAYLGAGFASHNDVLLWSLYVIKKLPRVLAILRARFGEMIVDEAQDTSPLQQHLLTLLESQGVQISFVGDPDQSIYQFNDAFPNFLRALYRTRPHKYKLTVNHRSSNQILESVTAHFGVGMTGIFDTASPLGAFVTVVSRADCLSLFENFLLHCNIAPQEAAILLRDSEGVRDFLGGIKTDDMNDAAKRLMGAIHALAVHDYSTAANRAASFLRAVYTDDGSDDQTWRALGWLYLRSHLPSASDVTVAEWIALVRESLETFEKEAQLTLKPRLSSNLTKRGFPTGPADQMLQPRRMSNIAIRSIHDAKGESIKAIMLHGKDSQHQQWLRGGTEEMRCLCFVAMTRAESLLLIACESEAIAAEWEAKGFPKLSSVFNPRSVR